MVGEPILQIKKLSSGEKINDLLKVTQLQMVELGFDHQFICFNKNISRYEPENPQNKMS